MRLRASAGRPPRRSAKRVDEVLARHPGQSDEPAKTLAAAGLSLALLRKETLRSEAGLPVEGWVVVASGS